MTRIILAFLGLAMLAAANLSGADAKTSGKRVSITGEIIDTWCYVSEIMFSEGTAHHQCAIWCAVGGIPVSIKDAKGNVFIILRIEEEDPVDNPRIIKIQSHQVTVNGDLYERDGIKYLIVTQVADDKGIINLTHEEYGIQPFGD
jgi:hypothetical protein